MRSPCLLVPRGEAESVRRRLRQEGLLRLDLKVRRLGNAVLLPVVNPVDYGFPIREEEFEVQGNPRVDYRALAEVPQEVKAQLPSSFDVLGDVAIIKMAGDLIQVKLEDGTTYDYKVTAKSQFESDSAPIEQIVGPTPKESVTLITCIGTFSQVTHQYDQRMVVRAERVA